MDNFPTARSPDKTRAAAWLVPAVCGALLLAGCKSEPAGQVAATVDGDEITLTELNAELVNMKLPEGADRKIVQQQALQRVVERKLLANAARHDEIDQTPEFIVRRQQLEDALLVQMLAQKVARGVKVPSPAEAAKFMNDNPNMFAARSILVVDQIRFATPSRDDYLKPLAAAHSMADVVAALDSLKVKYQRGAAQIDSAQMPRATIDQIRAVPQGEPFVVPAGNTVTVNLMTQTRPAPLTGDEARPVAINAARNGQLGEMIQQRLRAERAKAQISYQPGFAPPPKAAQSGPVPKPQ